jgi:hypothetical protein
LAESAAPAFHPLVDALVVHQAALGVVSPAHR